MKNHEYEPNIIEFFSRALNKESGSSYSFMRSSNPIDDGYLISPTGENIPVQLVQATDEELERKINYEIDRKRISAYTPLKPIKPIEKAIKMKSQKHYSHSKELLLLIDPSRCDEWVDEGLQYLQSLQELQNFRAVYLFYPSDQPKIFIVKSL